jgi:hypothetical protein
LLPPLLLLLLGCFHPFAIPATAAASAQ